MSPDTDRCEQGGALMQGPGFPAVLHHGARDGVTGSCHELRVDESNGILIDCGLFQGRDAQGREGDALEIEFPLSHIRALVVTHVHIDHVGRIPHLLAAGFKGPIYCSEPSALLLPLVLEDAVKIGFTRNRRLIERFVKRLKTQLVPLPYGRWHRVEAGSGSRLDIKLQPAGHILGSAYVQCRVHGQGPHSEKTVVFSGDLGAPYAPLLPAPRSPYRADMVVLESTYGGRVHEGRRERRQKLKAILERALGNRGVVLVPAFSIGRTQELLYELEELIHRYRHRPVSWDLPWDDLEIIVDSPLASRFTDAYRQLRPFWDAEARRKLVRGRHPLSFEQLTTIDSHARHLETVGALRQSGRPCVVIAASGMCSGGRIVNYLKALLGDARTDVLFVGYQGHGTPGRAILTYGPQGGYVVLDGRRYTIRAAVHAIGGYSAHADGQNLVNFVRRMRYTPRIVRLIHGEEGAKEALRRDLEEALPGIVVQ